MGFDDVFVRVEKNVDFHNKSSIILDISCDSAVAKLRMFVLFMNKGGNVCDVYRQGMTTYVFFIKI